MKKKRVLGKILQERKSLVEILLHSHIKKKVQWKLLAVECSNKPGWEIGGLTPDGDGSSSWTIAHTQLLFLLYTTHKHSPLNRSLHRHQSRINHVATGTRAVNLLLRLFYTAVLCLARIHVRRTVIDRIRSPRPPETTPTDRSIVVSLCEL